jgi:RNA polymerase sigma factor (sigma-70 family)
MDNPGSGPLRVLESSSNPERDLERQEFHSYLLRAMGKLSEGQREVFLRVDLEQGEQREVAEELGLNFGTLRTTLHQARKRLAGILRGMEEAL